MTTYLKGSTLKGGTIEGVWRPSEPESRSLFNLLLDPREEARQYSSTKRGFGTSQLSKLTSTTAWKPDEDTMDEWVQLDLGFVCNVTGVRIHKAADQGEYVTRVQVDA